MKNVFYLKALSGLRNLTDKSTEKRLEPLQEHLTFPALIYLRSLLHRCFCKIICLLCEDFYLWIISLEQEANIGWKLHHLCAGLCLFFVLKNTIDRFLCGKRPVEVISPRFQYLYFIPFFLFPVPVFFWWVERMYWQVRVSSLLLSRLSKTFFRCEITFKKWANSICENRCTNLLSRLPPALC